MSKSRLIVFIIEISDQFPLLLHPFKLSAMATLVREICLAFSIHHQTVCAIFRAMGIARVFSSLFDIFSDKLFPFRTIKNIFVSLFM